MYDLRGTGTMEAAKLLTWGRFLVKCSMKTIPEKAVPNLLEISKEISLGQKVVALEYVEVLVQGLFIMERYL